MDSDYDAPLPGNDAPRPGDDAPLPGDDQEPGNLTHRDYVRSLSMGGQWYTCIDTPTSAYQTWVLTEASITKFTFVSLIILRDCLLSFCHSCTGGTPETTARQWLTRTPEQLPLLFATTADGAKAAAALCCEDPCPHCAALIEVDPGILPTRMHTHIYSCDSSTLHSRSSRQSFSRLRRVPRLRWGY
jgi:hypothetical protein